MLKESVLLKNNDYFWLFVIITLGFLAGRLVLNEAYPVRLGLDLQGGLQVLLEADVPADRRIEDTPAGTRSAPR